MKKIFFTILSIFILLKVVYAHPLDISVSTANIKGTTFDINTYFHSFEIEYLLKKNGINPDGVNDYFENDYILKDYIKENIYFYNNGKKCSIGDISVEKDEAYKILSDGLLVNYSFKCEEKIEKLKLELNYFLEFKLQTNRITIYNLNNGIKDLKPIIFKVLTPKLNTLELDLNNLNIKRIDSDNDGLSDEEEKIYGTDPFNPDTDGDNYTDKEEIDYSWDPLNKELGPGQEYREKLDIDLSNKKISDLEEINKNIANKNLSDYGYNNDYLQKVMKYINDYFEKNTNNIFMIFFMVYILGILHAIGPGHSKGLVIAYSLEKQNGYKKGILFSLIFTLTHIIDIIILFFITKIISSFIDTGSYIYYIQLFSAILLLFIGIYLTYKAFKKQNKVCKKQTLTIAFLAGLTPCSFAWSIFLLLIALGKTSFIIPLVVALGLGIFTTLISIVIITIYFKNKAYLKVSSIGKYSSIISSLIILIISIILLYNLL